MEGREGRWPGGREEGWRMKGKQGKWKGRGKKGVDTNSSQLAVTSDHTRQEVTN